MISKLQIALDVWTLEDAFSILDEVVDYIDIIEAGTPLVVNSGIASLAAIKEKYPNKDFVIDAKITDEFYIAKKAFDAGADYTTVLGILSNESVAAVLDQGHKANKGVLIDLMNVQDKLQRSQEVKKLGASYVLVHCGLDEQRLGKTPLSEAKRIKENMDIKVVVAGGINLDTIDDYINTRADIIVVGNALVKETDRRNIAKQMRDKLNTNNK